jgi:hypothetical protein
MGSTSPDFAERMIGELNGRVKELKKDPGLIAWRPAYWQDILEQRELKYLRDAKRTGDLDAVRLRRFVVTAFGDAVAYQQVDVATNTAYKKIHERVREATTDLYVNQLNSESKPLVVMAHSLGCHIMSNYIWDMQHASEGDVVGLSSLEKMRTLAGMITFGCNIPLFTFAYAKVEPIEFPARQLSDEFKKKAKWLNYYDPDDILGYPLRSINAAYKKVVTKDIAVNVGGIFTSWNPVSHTRYWTDDDFTKPVAKFLASFLS